mmetsp:Transcript_12984/g.30934  ORF Transcript_12984/g.30934 Transcript_12984/m.30934 type:complete len:348 (-) Transcript_12984:464-1507(-)
MRLYGADEDTNQRLQEPRRRAHVGELHARRAAEVRGAKQLRIRREWPLRRVAHAAEQKELFAQLLGGQVDERERGSHRARRVRAVARVDRLEQQQRVAQRATPRGAPPVEPKEPCVERGDDERTVGAEERQRIVQRHVRLEVVDLNPQRREEGRLAAQIHRMADLGALLLLRLLIARCPGREERAQALLLQVLISARGYVFHVIGGTYAAQLAAQPARRGAFDAAGQVATGRKHSPSFMRVVIAVCVTPCQRQVDTRVHLVRVASCIKSVSIRGAIFAPTRSVLATAHYGQPQRGWCAWGGRVDGREQLQSRMARRGGVCTGKGGGHVRCLRHKLESLLDWPAGRGG